MKEKKLSYSVCPCCGKPYTGPPALSRADNLTCICPDCGTRQALEGLGLSKDEQDRIIETVHRHTIH